MKAVPFEEIITREADLNAFIQSEEKKQREFVGCVCNRKIKWIVVTAIISVIIAVTLGLCLGDTLFKHQVKGLHTTCYITTYGKCYHAAGCRYLWSSSQKTNVYSAKTRGYRACSICDVGEIDTSNKADIVRGLMTSFSVVTLSWILVIIYIDNKAKKRIKAEDSIKEGKIEIEKHMYAEYCKTRILQNGLLKLSGAPEPIQLINGKLYSKERNIYRYITRNGKCYHSDKKCAGRGIETLIYKIPTNYYACRKCAISFDRTIPEWYTKYEKLQSIIEQYGLK